MDAQFWNDLGMQLLRAMVPVLVAAVPALAAALLALAVQQIRLIQAKPTGYWFGKFRALVVIHLIVATSAI